jgi:hypothetical protein
MRSLYGTGMPFLPTELGSIKEGSTWCWEPLKIESRCYIRIVSVELKTDGGWWVLCQAIRDGNGIPQGRAVWNELSRFIEATVLLTPAP